MGMDVWGNAPRNGQGEYFRASIWSWRPIHCLIQEANSRFSLGFDLTDFDFNMGAGLGSQSACDSLADALEKLLAETSTESFTLDLAPQATEAAVLSLLEGAGVAVGLAPTLEGASAVAPLTYSADREHVELFIQFLRSCGGFEIW